MPATIEANLLDYEGGSLYGRHMRLMVFKRIRDEKKFDSLEALRAEVLKNRGQVRDYFQTERAEMLASLYPLGGRDDVPIPF